VVGPADERPNFSLRVPGLSLAWESRPGGLDSSGQAASGATMPQGPGGRAAARPRYTEGRETAASGRGTGPRLGRFLGRHVAPAEKRPPAPSPRRGARHALRVGGRKTGA
jgi:hypothetical protein